VHCLEVDRVARRSEYHHIIKAQLAKLGIALVSVTEPISDDPSGNLMESVLAAIAQFDNDVRTLRTTTGMKARTEQGGWPHDAPYGYKNARAASGVASLAPDPDTAPIVTALLEKCATGDYTVKQLADVAYELGVRNKSGGKRGWQAVKGMLVSPLYAGFVRSAFTNGKHIKGLHPPLISEATHYRILALFNGESRSHNRQPELDWPLRGFLRHTCGKAMTGSAPRTRP
jgi:site-specific DNA recombinase